MPSGNALIIDDNGFHAFAADCSIEADILVPNMFEQLEAEGGTSKKRSPNAPKKRSQTDFQVDIQLSDQCGNLVTTQIFPDSALALGSSQCSLLPSPQTNPSTGVWSWRCQYPSLQSAEGQCETAVTKYLNGFFGAFDAVGYAVIAAANFLLYGPAIGVVEFTELVPILRTGVEGVNIALKPVDKIGNAVGKIGADNVASTVCSIMAAPPYDLVFSPSSGPAIDLTPLESAPVFVLSYSETIQNDQEPPNCTPPVECQPSTAQLDGAWDLPCNVIPNPGLEMQSLDVFGYPAGPAGNWGDGSISTQWLFGYGGMNGTGLPDGSNGCESGTGNDTCITIQTTTDSGSAWLINSVNSTEFQNAPYVFSAYVDVLSIQGTAAPTSTISECLVNFKLDLAQGTIPPAETFTQPTNGFQVVSSDVQVTLITTTYVPADIQGFIIGQSANVEFGISVQCPVGVSATFVIDNLSVCDSDGLCASLVQS